MNTSGVAEPPEIVVASVARFVSVFVGAETSVTWMFGYCFSNALISTVRVSVAPLPAIGLADQTIEPDVVDPVADDAPPAGADVVLLLPPVVVLLLLQPARTSAPATPTRAVSCQLLTGRLPGSLIDRSRTMRPPSK
jgi:hypothetical protein